MKKQLFALLLMLTVFFLGCQRTSTEEVNPQTIAKSSVASSNKNVRSGGGITTQDVTPVNFQNRGTVQFQWAGNTASQSWIGETAWLTNAERINILDQASAKIGVASDRTNFKCAYDRAKADILANKRFSAGNPSYNYVKNCCQNCAQALGDVNGARCDFQVNKGTF